MPSALQQYLPFTVLKHFKCILLWIDITWVATVLTVYGIETWITTILRAVHKPTLQQYLPFTVLKPKYALIEATLRSRCNSTYRLRY